MADHDALDDHWRMVAAEILDGRVIPFLGAGANLCGRPPKLTWPGLDSDWLPNGSELSNHLAQKFTYQGKNRDDLVRVSQFVTLALGPLRLYEALRELFDRDYPATDLHKFLAEVPSILRERQAAQPYQLIVTTNFDDVLERTFRQADEPFDLVTYDAETPYLGRFIHHPHGGEPIRIVEPNAYDALPIDERTVILKIHGAVDRVDRNRDSYVITEDHYIDYLARTEVSKLFPVTLVEMLRRSHCLFLGYSLRDWHLRVILNRIWGEERLRASSWAVVLDPDTIDEGLWRKRDVMILNAPLDHYVAGLRDALHALAPQVPAPQVPAPQVR